jgi:hypothetical protein
VLVTLQIFDDFVFDLPGFSSEFVGGCKGAACHGRHLMAIFAGLRYCGGDRLSVEKLSLYLTGAGIRAPPRPEQTELKKMLALFRSKFFGAYAYLFAQDRAASCCRYNAATSLLGVRKVTHQNGPTAVGGRRSWRDVVSQFPKCPPAHDVTFLAWAENTRAGPRPDALLHRR